MGVRFKCQAIASCPRNQTPAARTATPTARDGDINPPSVDGGVFLATPETSSFPTHTVRNGQQAVVPESSNTQTWSRAQQASARAITEQSWYLAGHMVAFETSSEVEPAAAVGAAVAGTVGMKAPEEDVWPTTGWSSSSRTDRRSSDIERRCVQNMAADVGDRGLGEGSGEFGGVIGADRGRSLALRSPRPLQTATLALAAAGSRVVVNPCPPPSAVLQPTLNVRLCNHDSPPHLLWPLSVRPLAHLQLLGPSLLKGHPHRPPPPSRLRGTGCLVLPEPPHPLDPHCRRGRRLR